MNINKKLIIIIIFIVLAISYIDLFHEQKNHILVEENGTINTYFCLYDKCEYELIKITNNSKSLKCAFYDLTNKNLTNHLQKENAQIITHNQKEFEKINTVGLMHHKFCIINMTHITTGSYNPTENNFHHENLIIIESRTLAKNYEKEFEQIKKQNKNENYEKEETQTQKIIFNDYELENYFCPQDDCREKIIQKIKNANKSINFLLFTFTDKKIAQEIINKKNEGLQIKGIIENFQNKQYWALPMLQQNNVTIKIHSSNNFQHNKIIIVDNTVILGSYNPTNAANTINDENLLIIKQPEIVKKYKNYFDSFFEDLD